ncbi:MAG: tetratricopeptide repeat protein [Actinomycetota bacterium]
MSFGARLKKLRVAKGLTQRELASPRYSPAFVSSIESGRRRPSQAALEHFALVLQVDEEELSSGRPADLAPRLEAELQAARVAQSAGRLEEARSDYTRIHKQSQRFELFRIAAAAQGGLGRCAEQEGQLDDAITMWESAERLLAEQPPLARVDAVLGKTRCLSARGDKRFAIHLLESLRDELERSETASPEALMKISVGLVNPYLELGLHKQAQAAADEAMALAPQVSEPLTLGLMNLQVARVLLDQGAVDDAHAALRRSGDLFSYVDLQTEMGAAHLARGYVFLRQGERDEARAELELALAIFERARRRIDKARAANELARLEREEGRLSTARQLLSRAISLLGDSDVAELALSYRELALCDRRDDPTKAEKNFRRALELYELADERIELALTYGAFGDFHSARGNVEQASENYRLGISSLAQFG